jgi:hypothetical protein
MITETLYRDVESTRKQLKMPEETYELLKSGDNKGVTKGVVAYESLLFHFEEYEDSLSQIESRINDELDTHHPSLSQTLDKIKKFSVSSGSVSGDELKQVENVNYMEQVNIHLPEILEEQLVVQRGVGDHIAEAVRALEHSVFSDRMDRITAKEEVLEYIEEGGEYNPDHVVAQSIVGGDRGEVSEIVEELVDPSDVNDKVRNNFDLDVGEAMEIITSDEIELPKSRKYRVPVVYSSFSGIATESGMKSRINLLDSDVNPQTVKNYVRELKERMIEFRTLDIEEVETGYRYNISTSYGKTENLVEEDIENALDKLVEAYEKGMDIDAVEEKVRDIHSSYQTKRGEEVIEFLEAEKADEREEEVRGVADEMMEASRQASEGDS